MWKMLQLIMCCTQQMLCKQPVTAVTLSEAPAALLGIKTEQVTKAHRPELFSAEFLLTVNVHFVYFRHPAKKSDKDSIERLLADCSNVHFDAMTCNIDVVS